MILFKTLTELQASIVWKRLAYIAWDNVLWFIKWHLYKMQVKLCNNFICLLQAICPPQTPVQFNCSVMSYSLWSHGLQHARPPCPSLTPGVYPNLCPLSWWCHLTISSFCPLLLLPSIFPNIRVFSNESALHIRWPKYWSFSFNINPSNEHPGLISFRMDWLDLLPVQGTLKSLLQHHSSKVSIFWRSAFFIVQLSYWYMPIGKTIALILFPSLQVQEARF